MTKSRCGIRDIRIRQEWAQETVLAGAKKDDGAWAHRYICVTQREEGRFNETERAPGFHK